MKLIDFACRCLVQTHLQAGLLCTAVF